MTGRGRRLIGPAILLVTDGGDNSSNIKLHDIVKTRRQGEALVYACRTDDFSVKGPNARLPQADVHAPMAIMRGVSIGPDRDGIQSPRDHDFVAE